MNNNLPKLSGFLPRQEDRRYADVGRCIYCGSTDALSDEHIIPYSLGGNFVLPKSSCAECAKTTSYFEHTCMRTMYGPLRLLYDMPTRRKKQRPEKLPLKIKFGADQPDWQLVDVRQEEYPFLITFPYFDAPGILAGRSLEESEGPRSKQFWIRGGCPYGSFDEVLPALANKLNAHSLFPESKADIPSFCRLLAKIAYSFALAECGPQAFGSDLSRIILGKDLNNCRYYIGSASGDEPVRNTLHDLAMLKFCSNIIAVKIRLLCKLGTPTYFVAVSKN